MGRTDRARSRSILWLNVAALVVAVLAIVITVGVGVLAMIPSWLELIAELVAGAPTR